LDEIKIQRHFLFVLREADLRLMLERKSSRVLLVRKIAVPIRPPSSFILCIVYIFFYDWSKLYNHLFLCSVILLLYVSFLSHGLLFETKSDCSDFFLLLQMLFVKLSLSQNHLPQ